mmetsp:Transcript_103490/g.278067  ORF Transcript_103490/g.278067 Transcript_103490/m.278067 type:complete len:391 (-) Transcript_103490:480-1652(-)
MSAQGALQHCLLRAIGPPTLQTLSVEGVAALQPPAWAVVLDLLEANDAGRLATEPCRKRGGGRGQEAASFHPPAAGAAASEAFTFATASRASLRHFSNRVETCGGTGARLAAGTVGTRGEAGVGAVAGWRAAFSTPAQTVSSNPSSFAERSKSRTAVLSKAAKYTNNAVLWGMHRALRTAVSMWRDFTQSSAVGSRWSVLLPATSASARYANDAFRTPTLFSARSRAFIPPPSPEHILRAQSCSMPYSQTNLSTTNRVPFNVRVKNRGGIFVALWTMPSRLRMLWEPRTFLTTMVFPRKSRTKIWTPWLATGAAHIVTEAAVLRGAEFLARRALALGFVPRIPDGPIRRGSASGLRPSAMPSQSLSQPAFSSSTERAANRLCSFTVAGNL